MLRRLLKEGAKMAKQETLDAVKLALRVSTSALDSDIGDEIDACLADLRICGVKYADEGEELILNAVKLWCRAIMAEDVNRAQMYHQRYDGLKACLMMAEEYRDE